MSEQNQTSRAAPFRGRLRFGNLILVRIRFPEFMIGKVILRRDRYGILELTPSGISFSKAGKIYCQAGQGCDTI